MRPREGGGDGPQNREVRHGYMAGDIDESGWGLCVFSRTNWTFPALGFLKAIYEAGLIQPSCATISKQGLLCRFRTSPLPSLYSQSSLHPFCRAGNEGVEVRQVKLNLSPALVPPYVSSRLTLAGLTWTPGGSHKSESGWLLLCVFAGGTWQVLLNFSELQFSHLQNGRNDA